MGSDDEPTPEGGAVDVRKRIVAVLAVGLLLVLLVALLSRCGDDDGDGGADAGESDALSDGSSGDDAEASGDDAEGSADGEGDDTADGGSNGEGSDGEGDSSSDTSDEGTASTPPAPGSTAPPQPGDPGLDLELASAVDMGLAAAEVVGDSCEMAALTVTATSFEPRSPQDAAYMRPLVQSVFEDLIEYTSSSQPDEAAIVADALARMLAGLDATGDPAPLVRDTWLTADPEVADAYHALVDGLESECGQDVVPG